MTEKDSGNGKGEFEVEVESPKSLSVWSQQSSSLIFFKKPPLLLANFPVKLAERFLTMGFDESYDFHEQIMKQGQIGRDMFLICEGEVAIYSQGIKLATLLKGDVFGELILFRDHYRIASVRVEKNARILRFSREVLMDFFARNEHKIFNIYMMNLMEILRRKLISTNKKVVNLEKQLLNL